MSFKIISIVSIFIIGFTPLNGQDTPDTTAPPDAPSAKTSKKGISLVQRPSNNTRGDTIPGLDISKVPDTRESDGGTPKNSSASGTTHPTAVQAANGKEGEGSGIIEETEGGYWLKDAPLNEVFQYLAQRSQLQYFYNTNLSGPDYLVTGQLVDAADPVAQMEELGLMYEVTIYKQGNTVYALVPSQLSVLPNKPTSYQLHYLRPSDIDKIKVILQPFLTPGTGVVEYEEKTNTIVVFDNNEKNVAQLMALLEKIDQPKQQVAIETRILRVKSSARNRIGVDWSSVLGEGTALRASVSLNNLFNLPDLDTVSKVLTLGAGETGTRNRNYSGSTLIFSPPQIQAVVRALNSGGLVQQESSPTLITEDNEEGIISVIDRIPIIVSTVSATTVGQNTTDTVRYKIDSDDPVGDPANTREIGVTVSVTPTILPDETIRMSLRPRSSQIIDFIESNSGNSYPRVNESSISTMARVPDGYSLLIGGFYEEVDSDDSKKVPILGDLPGANFLFKSDDKSKEHTSLVFIVTPTLYRPSSVAESEALEQELHDTHILPVNHDSPDPERPGFNYKPSLKNTFAGIFKSRRATPSPNPLVPRLKQQYQPRKESVVESPYQGSVYPQAESNTPAPRSATPAPTVATPPEPSAQASPVSSTKSGFFKQLFGRKQSH